MQDNFEVPQNEAQPSLQPKPYMPPLASIFERAIAFIIDFLLYISVSMWSVYLMIVKGDIITTGTQDMLISVGFLFLFVLYSAVLSSGGRQTLGKFLMGIKVVGKNGGGYISFPRAFLRSFGYIINLITFLGGFALALLNKRRRALQDLLAGTEVISVREKTPVESIIISALGTMLIGGCALYLYYLIFLMPSFKDTAKVAAAQRQVDKIAFLQEYHKYYFGTYTPDLVRLGLVSGDAVQFQRDVQRNLRRRGFSMGVGKDGYSIKAIAKDKKETEVSTYR